jgi:hypothetical protein
VSKMLLERTRVHYQIIDKVVDELTLKIAKQRIDYPRKQYLEDMRTHLNLQNNNIKNLIKKK